MKKILFIVMLLGSIVPLMAENQARLSFERNHQYEARLSWSGMPTLVYLHYFGDPDNYHRRFTLNALYQTYDGPMYTTGNIMAEFVYVRNQKSSVSCGLSFSDCFGKTFNSIDGSFCGYRHEVIVLLMPRYKAYWFREPSISMYSSFGLGLGFYGKQFFAFPQFDFIGIEVGKDQFYAFSELMNAGLFCFGATIGLGYRF